MDELETLMAMADVIGVPPAETALQRVGHLFRRGAFEPALTTIKPAPEVMSGGLRATPIGDYGSFLAAFTAISGPTAASAGAARMGERHGELIARLVRTTTPKWYDNWTAAAITPRRPPPIFRFAGDRRPPGATEPVPSLFG
jgi:hypothetical protein